MSVKCFYLALFLTAIACQTTTTLSATTPANTVQAGVATAEEAVTDEPPPRWIEFTANGVSLGVNTPNGWEAQTTDKGILLAEYASTMAIDGTLNGIQVYIFVRRLDDFSVPVNQSANLAWLVLNQVIERPDYIGDAAVSEPVGFDWNGYDAAYYLLNNGDGNLTVLLAVVIPPSHLLVCNISAPAHSAGRIRATLPALLSGLTLNDTTLDSAALDTLPDPLVFPEYVRRNRGEHRGE